MLVRIANREDPDQTKQSDLSLHCLSRPFGRQLLLKILEHLTYTYQLTVNNSFAGKQSS